MTSKRKAVAATFVILLYLHGDLKGYTEVNSKTRAAAVLFKQFETVVFTRTDFLASFDIQDLNHSDGETTLRLPFLEFIGGLQALGPDAVKDIEHGYPVLLVGAKDFASPNGLGMVSSRNCYIGMLEGATQPSVTSSFRKAKYESIEGRHIWTWSIPPYEGYPMPTTFYAAQIAGSYFLMTNDRQAFQDAARALTSRESLRGATPIPALGWDTFSTHKYWAHRSPRWSEVRDKDAAGLTTLAPAVVDLTFFADVDEKISYFQVDSSDKSIRATPKGLPASELIRFQLGEAGIWQAKILLSDDTALSQVFYFFGFGVAL